MVSKFAFKFNLYRYSWGRSSASDAGGRPSKQGFTCCQILRHRNEVGLYKLNSVYPQLESAWFQPLHL